MNQVLRLSDFLLKRTTCERDGWKLVERCEQSNQFIVITIKPSAELTIIDDISPFQKSDNQTVNCMQFIIKNKSFVRYRTFFDFSQSVESSHHKLCLTFRVSSQSHD